MAYNYITKASYIALALLTVALILSSNYYSDSFFAFLLNLPLRVDPFLLRAAMAVILSYFFLLLFHQLTHKHPWPLAYIVLLSFLFSPVMVENLFLLKDLPFLLAMPFIILSYVAFRYNFYGWGLLFMIISLLDPRAAVAYIPMFVMHYIKYGDKRSLLFTALLFLYYLLTSPSLSFSPESVGTLLVFSALSLAFYEEARPLAGFLTSLPFLNNPYVIFPLLVISLDIIHRVGEKGHFHKHLAVSLIVFFLTIYLLWGLPFQKVLGAALLTTIFFGSLSYLTKNVGEYFYIMLFLTVLVELALALSFFTNLELFGIDMETAIAISQFNADYVLGHAYFYTYLTGKDLPPYNGGEGKVIIPLYAVKELYPIRLDVPSGDGAVLYPVGEHTILYLPYGYTTLDKAMRGVVLYESPSALVVER